MFWTDEMCHKVMAAACQKAKEEKIGISIAIYERHGLEQMFHRMGCAKVCTIKFAKAKAYTAAMLGIPTKDLAAMSSKDKGELPAFQCMDPMFTLIKGGCPVIWNGRIAGGIGVSGGTVDKEEEIAEYLVGVVMDYCKENPPKKGCPTTTK